MPIFPIKISASPQFLRAAPLLAMLVIAALLASGLFNKPEFENRKSPAVGYNVGRFTIPSLDGKSTVSNATLKNKIVVVNFFASWCETCIIEHPTLMRLAQSGKVEMVGIAWRSKPDETIAWLNKHGNPYHHIGLDIKGNTTLAFAISGVPETYIIDKNGKIAYNHKAAINDEIVDTVILPMVEHLRNNDAPAAD